MVVFRGAAGRLKASVLVGVLLCSGVVLTLDSVLPPWPPSSCCFLLGLMSVTAFAVAAFTLPECVLRFS